MHRNPARIGFGRGDAIECRLERRRHGAVGIPIRPRPAWRRHFVSAEFARHFFPQLRGSADILDVHAVEGQARNLELLVVARNAVLIENRARRDSLRNGPGRGGKAQSEPN